MKLSLGIAFFVGSILIAYFAVKNLYSVYPNLPVLRDFLFEHLPVLDLLLFSDLIVILASLSFITFAILSDYYIVASIPLCLSTILESILTVAGFFLSFIKLIILCKSF